MGTHVTLGILDRGIMKFAIFGIVILALSTKVLGYYHRFLPPAAYSAPRVHGSNWNLMPYPIYWHEPIYRHEPPQTTLDYDDDYSDEEKERLIAEIQEIFDKP